MSTKGNALYAALHQHIAIGHDPRIPDEAHMRKFRIVIEDEKTGQEFAGFLGLSRARAQAIAEHIKHTGDHDEVIGRMPNARKTRKAPQAMPRASAHAVRRGSKP